MPFGGYLCMYANRNLRIYYITQATQMCIHSTSLNLNCWFARTMPVYYSEINSRKQRIETHVIREASLHESEAWPGCLS